MADRAQRGLSVIQFMIKVISGEASKKGTALVVFMESPENLESVFWSSEARHLSLSQLLPLI